MGGVSAFDVRLDLENSNDLGLGFINANSNVGHNSNNLAAFSNAGKDISGNFTTCEHKEDVSFLRKRKDRGQQTPPNLSQRTPRKNKLMMRLSAARSIIRSLKNENRKLKEENRKYKEENQSLKALQKNNVYTDESRVKEAKESWLNNIKEIMPVGATNIIENELKNVGKSKVGRRYSDETKRFALMVYFTAPACYNFLKDILQLPCKRTLQMYTQDLPTGPGIHEAYFEILKIKGMTIDNAAKNCVISIDEASIKGHLCYNRASDMIIGLEDDGEHRSNVPARNALVVMVRGITAKWKHLLRFVFVNSTCSPALLKGLIFKAVRSLRKIGFKPRLIVSDQGGNFQRLTDLLEITSEKPYFYVSKGEGDENNLEFSDQKIRYMFDPPHLIKSIRNNFEKYIVRFDNEKVAKWRHIEQLFEYDSKQNIKLAPKLTASHIHPNNFEKIKVKYATQALSTSVGASLRILVVGEILPEAAETADFVEFWDTAFDLFNSSRLHDPKKMKQCFSGQKEQLKLLDDMERIINSIKLEDKEGRNRTSGVKCLKGWLLSIASLKGLWEDLNIEEGITSIFTRRLNQDCLELTFNTIRKQGGNCRNPTPQQFIRAFKKISAAHLFELTSSGNCEMEQGAAIALFEDHIKSGTSPITESVEKEHALIIHNPDYRNLDFVQENAICYFSGYLLKKCREVHQCHLCNNDGEARASASFIEHKRYEGCNLVIPPPEFVKFISDLEDNFLEHFERLSSSKTIRKELCAILHEVPPCHLCSEFPADFLIKFFVRVRIYFVLKFYNNENTKKFV